MINSGIVQLQNSRAEAVRSEIKTLQGNLKDRTFDLADLLAEAKENDYASLWGYETFKDWIDNSELDVKVRQADYLINIVTKAKVLNISRDQLRLIKITKLKLIFSLPIEQADLIRDLVKRAPNMTTEEVEAEFRKAAGIESPKGTWRNFYFPEPDAAESVDQAVEDVKTVAGADMTPSRCLELICATFEASEVEAVLEEQRREIEGA